jgi:putative Mn2+ efflux pump MntP
MATPSTGYDVHDLLWGRPRDRRRHWRRFVGGYILAILGLYALYFLLDRVVDPTIGTGLGETLYSPILPVALFYSPPFVSAASAYRDGGMLTSVVVGVAPSLVFGAAVTLDVLARLVATGAVVTRGDTPLWGLMLVFGVLGVIGSLAGFLVGVVARVGVDRFRAR